MESESNVPPLSCYSDSMLRVKYVWGKTEGLKFSPSIWGGICALDSLNSGQQSLFICCLSCNFMHCHYSCTFDPVIGWAEETELLSCLPQDWGSQWQGGDRLPGSSITSSTEKGADHSPFPNWEWGMVCAALTGAQLAKVLSTELSLPIHQVFLWADSTTVLTWLQSNSCQFKVLVGTRVAEIQDLTEREAWSYVDSTQNPADDITWREKTVGALNTALLVSRPILPLLLIRGSIAFVTVLRWAGCYCTKTRNKHYKITTAIQKVLCGTPSRKYAKMRRSAVR